MKILAEVVTTGCLLGGLAALTYGSYLIYRPLGFLVPGAAFFTLGLIAELRG